MDETVFVIIYAAVISVALWGVMLFFNWWGKKGDK